MRKELERLREEMRQAGCDAYITADCDDHLGEYTDRHFNCMEFVSGFTGGDGTLVVTMEEAGLWTDGRYFIQAEKELKGSGITLMKEGQPDCPEMLSWICEHIPVGGTLGFDGKTVSFRRAKELERKLALKGIDLSADNDLIAKIWTEGRPAPREEKIWILPERYAGKSAGEKIKELKSDLRENGAGACLLTAGDEIAWLLNLRGDDIPYCPTFASFFLMDGEQSTLYISEPHLTEETKRYLSDLGIRTETEVLKVYEDIRALRSDVIVIDDLQTSWSMVQNIPAEKDVIYSLTPAAIRKNRKNEVECENLRKAQQKDCVAVTKFMYRFKKEMASGSLTECGTADLLHELRAEQEGFLGESFATISAYGENAAMCHYSPSRERDVTIRPRGLYLVDSGGHYPEGSTDITRTWACGPLTQEEKEGYTMVACANLRLADAVFPKGTNGLTLDYAVRELFWKKGMDFNHGTGHGVGYLLNVHEGPANIRFRANSSTVCDRMEEGVYVSDEPGLYVEGKFGIRLENMLLVVKDHENDFGQFLTFETMTYVPFDREAMEPSLMTEEDKRLYNTYQRNVFEKMSPFLTEEENVWLRKICEPLS